MDSPPQGRPLIGEQFKLRLLTAQRGGEVLHLLWSALDLDAGLWTKAFQFRKRKPTDTHQHPHLVPLAPRAVAILRKLKDYQIGWVAGTYSPYAYVEHKRYVAYAIENTVREAIGMKPMAMPPRPLA